MSAAIRTIEQNRHFPILAYVPVNPFHFRAIAALGAKGLAGVIVHPIRDWQREFWNLVHRATPDPLTCEFYSVLEARLGTLPGELSRALEDLISRPARYQRGADLAHQAGIPIKRVYRVFAASGLGTPKRLVIATKLLRACARLNDGESVPAVIRAEFGHTELSHITTQTRSVFGCSLGDVARHDSHELVRRLLEWLYKPSYRRISFNRLSQSVRLDTARGCRSASRISTL